MYLAFNVAVKALIMPPLVTAIANASAAVGS
jgi:hypothetical protein